MQVKQLKFLLLFLLSLLSLPSVLWGNFPPLPATASIIPTPPELASKSYLLMDYLSDYIIAEHDIDQRVEPASLTKMMTVYVVDQALKSKKIKLDDTVLIGERAWRTMGSRMFLDLNSLVSVEDLLRGVIIQSGNDASVALAEHVAGSEPVFAELMNYYAKQLGMNNTHFVNATGLPDPNHYTTARDMGILGKALIRDFPETYKMYAQKEFTYKNIKQTNRNRLLWRNEDVDGIKTGHTENAGYCLVASGHKDNMRLIAVVMGTKNDNIRTDETNKLLNYGFRFYETRKLYPANVPVKQTRIWGGAQKELNLGLADDLFISIGRGQYDKLKANINVNKVVKAPVAAGTPLGTLSISLNDKVIAEKPIVALNNVEPAGFFGRIYDSFAVTLQSLWERVMS